MTLTPLHNKLNLAPLWFSDYHYNRFYITISPEQAHTRKTVYSIYLVAATYENAIRFCPIGGYVFHHPATPFRRRLDLTLLGWPVRPFKRKLKLRPGMLIANTYDEEIVKLERKALNANKKAGTYELWYAIKLSDNSPTLISIDRENMWGLVNHRWYKLHNSQYVELDEFVITQ